MSQTSWTRRPWAPGDAADLATLHAAVAQSGEAAGAEFAWHGPRIDEPGRQSLTLVAIDDTAALLGAGTLYESAVAPARWRLALHVHPARCRQGIGTALLNALASGAARRDDRALQVGLSDAATGSMEFFVRRGFRHLMRTRLGVLDPARIPDSTWLRIAEAERQAQQHEVRIRPLSALEGRARITSAIAELHARIYGQTHPWSPLVPLDAETASALYLGDDLIPEALFVAFKGDHPIGVSSLRRSETMTAFDLGWTGALIKLGPLVRDLTLALLGRSLGFARAARRAVTVEVDAADTVLWDLVGTLPVKFGPDWLNLERPSSRSTRADEVEGQAISLSTLRCTKEGRG